MMTQTIAIRRTFKYRLYQHRRKDKHLHQMIDIAGIIWNHCLAVQKRYYRLFGKHVTEDRMKALIKDLRNGRRYGYWKKLGSQAVQDVIERLERAFTQFFNKKAGLPRFKKVKKYKSFTLKQTAGWGVLPDIKAPCDKEKKRGIGLVRIGKQHYKYVKHRELRGKVKTVTIKRDVCGRLWICFSVEQEIEVPVSRGQVSTDEIGGFDFGLQTFLTDHTGQPYHAPEHYKQRLAHIKLLSRAVSRKVKGSNNQRKARHLLNRTHIRIADQRRDFHYKLAHALCKQYPVLVFEDLTLEGMKHLWGRKISDVSFSKFLKIVEWVALKQGKQVIKIDRFIPTTQTCSSCGYRQAMPLKQRIFDCERCDLVLNRDHNAAINIQQAGASAYTKRGLRKTSA